MALIPQMTYAEARDATLQSIGISYWLKEAIRALDRRDPVDAAQDAEDLVALMLMRADEMRRDRPQ